MAQQSRVFNIITEYRNLLPCTHALLFTTTYNSSFWGSDNFMACIGDPCLEIQNYPSHPAVNRRNSGNESLLLFFLLLIILFRVLLLRNVNGHIKYSNNLMTELRK